MLTSLRTTVATLSVMVVALIMATTANAGGAYTGPKPESSTENNSAYLGVAMLLVIATTLVIGLVMWLVSRRIKNRKN